VSSNGKLPPEVVRHWPEVFKDVEIQTIPVQYLVSIRVEFEDGKIWEIELDKSKLTDDQTIEDSLSTFFDEYSESIINIDFRLDTQKVIRDVKERTKQFMKKRK
jgi:hypothetical protein